MSSCRYLVFFFFNDTATTEIYTLSLHDALPIWERSDIRGPAREAAHAAPAQAAATTARPIRVSRYRVDSLGPPRPGGHRACPASGCGRGGAAAAGRRGALPRAVSRAVAHSP